jgi:putative addiction module CopG family antidote
MTVSLTAELDRMGSEQIASGRFRTPDEVVCEASRRLDESDQSVDAELAAFNRELSERIAGLKRADPAAVQPRLALMSEERRRQKV